MWVLVGDELRMDKVNSYDDLIGENGDLVKCYGTYNINPSAKGIEFIIDPILTNESWITELSRIKVQGFYTPMIQNYMWYFSINNEYPKKWTAIS